MRKKGSITVFLALILSLMVALMSAGLRSVQMAAARTQILNGMDIALFSLFGQYDKALLKDYDLFALDVSGGDSLDLTMAYDELESYMKPVLKQNSQKLKLEQGAITGYRLLTDGNGEVFFQQIVRYMKDTMGSQGVKLLMKELREKKTKTQISEKRGTRLESKDPLSSYDSEIHTAQSKSDAAKKEQQKQAVPKQQSGGGGDFTDGSDLPGTGQDLPQTKVKNPIPAIKRVRWRGILSLVLQPGADVSSGKVKKKKLVSGRKLETGFQMPDEITKDSSSTSQLLYQQYLMEKLGNYMKNGKGELKYQIEYILCGKNQDKSNLRDIAKKLLLIREGVNAASLAADNVKRSQAAALAAAIASGFLIPPAASVIEGALILCWAYAESILDVRELFAGGKVPLVKDATQWQLSLENLPGLLTNLDTLRRNDAGGLSYEDYLQILLLSASKQNKVLRGMDMLELSVREAENWEDFRLDHCLTGLEASAQVTANKRKGYEVTRQYCYE